MRTRRLVSTRLRSTSRLWRRTNRRRSILTRGFFWVVIQEKKREEENAAEALPDMRKMVEHVAGKYLSFFWFRFSLQVSIQSNESQKSLLWITASDSSEWAPRIEDVASSVELGLRDPNKKIARKMKKKKKNSANRWIRVKNEIGSHRPERSLDLIKWDSNQSSMDQTEWLSLKHRGCSFKR